MERRQNVGSAKSGSRDPMYDRLASMNMSELQQEARRAGVNGPSGMRKEQLIAAIKSTKK